MKVVIIAAGMGSRLWESTRQKPKTLLPFGHGTILSTIIERFRSIGIDEFVIVTGYQGDEIVRYVERENHFGVGVEFVENRDWSRGNGLSVLAAAEAVGGAPFILSMSDHVVSPAALARMAGHPSERNLLLVDRRVEDAFDLDDATKVQVEDGQIVEIGKELPAFNALDCGIFRLNERFIRAMRVAAKSGVESISGGVRTLVESGDMEAVDLAPGEEWMDLDTPEAYGYGLLLTGGDPAPVTPRSALAAIRARRTCKRFADRPIDRPRIEELIELATCAPNHRMTEPWRFLVLGPEARRAYGEALGARRARKIENADAAKAVFDKTVRESVGVPGAIGVVQRLHDDEEIREEDFAAVYMAIQNLLLGAVPMGLGTYLRTGAVLGDAPLREAWGVQDDERIVAMVQLGEPAELPSMKPRLPVEAVARWLP